MFGGSRRRGRGDQRQRDFDLRFPGAMPCVQGEPADRDAEQDLADDDDREGAGGLRQREQPGRNGSDRETIEDQCRGIVGEPFALD